MDEYGLEIGGFRVKIVRQERKEYDDKKLYEALFGSERVALAVQAGLRQNRGG